MNLREKVARFISPELANRADAADNHEARIEEAVKFDAKEYEIYKSEMENVSKFLGSPLWYNRKRVPRRPVDPMMRASLFAGGRLPKGEADYGYAIREIDACLNRLTEQDYKIPTVSLIVYDLEKIKSGLSEARP
ncbi:hypothetical protein U2P60_14720 [Brucella sp. H1_1004]|uniref:hypothetical protein n=1 Tax=Brucella sp. H1_1004 TaxID=3110109 RepID=UPI0039B587B1